MPGSVDGLRALVATGVRVGVDLNADGSSAQRLAAQEVLQVGPGLGVEVECVIDSGAVGVSKPDPRIFHIALDAMGVDAADAWYVGDMPGIDVVGARDAGLWPIVMDPFGFQPDADYAPRDVAVRRRGDGQLALSRAGGRPRDRAGSGTVSGSSASRRCCRRAPRLDRWSATRQRAIVGADRVGRGLLAPRRARSTLPWSAASDIGRSRARRVAATAGAQSWKNAATAPSASIVIRRRRNPERVVELGPALRHRAARSRSPTPRARARTRSRYARCATSGCTPASVTTDAAVGVADQQRLAVDRRRARRGRTSTSSGSVAAVDDTDGRSTAIERRPRGVEARDDRSQHQAPVPRAVHENDRAAHRLGP